MVWKVSRETRGRSTIKLDWEGRGNDNDESLRKRVKWTKMQLLKVPAGRGHTQRKTQKNAQNLLFPAVDPVPCDNPPWADHVEDNFGRASLSP